MVAEVNVESAKEVAPATKNVTRHVVLTLDVSYVAASILYHETPPDKAINVSSFRIPFRIDDVLEILVVGKDGNAVRGAKHEVRKSFKEENERLQILLADVPVKQSRSEFP